MLKFSEANAKIKELKQIPSLQKYLRNKRKVYSFDLLSGHSCPGAKECLSKVKIINDKKTVVDGIHTKFRCFSASQEVLFPNVYKLRKYNFDIVRNIKASIDMLLTISRSLPTDLGIGRIHVGRIKSR